jgi:hypothetical protein
LQNQAAYQAQLGVYANQPQNQALQALLSGS